MSSVPGVNKQDVQKTQVPVNSGADDEVKSKPATVNQTDTISTANTEQPAQQESKGFLAATGQKICSVFNWITETIVSIFRNIFTCFGLFSSKAKSDEQSNAGENNSVNPNETIEVEASNVEPPAKVALQETKALFEKLRKEFNPENWPKEYGQLSQENKDRIITQDLKVLAREKHKNDSQPITEDQINEFIKCSWALRDKCESYVGDLEKPGSLDPKEEVPKYLDRVIVALEEEIKNQPLEEKLN